MYYRSHRLQSFKLLRLLAGLCAAGLGALAAESISIEAEVRAVDLASRSFELKLLRADPGAGLPAEPGILRAQVGPGDLELGYVSRPIRAEAVYYNQAWHLEQVFPTDAPAQWRAANAQLRRETEALRRGSFLKAGSLIPDFGLIDQQGNFLRAGALRGKAFVLNFIFTRCQAPTMCPASTLRMAQLQQLAPAAGLEQLHFVSLSFDPEYDSPGVLRQYAAGYGIEFDNFHLLTGPRQVVEDLLRQFGILTRQEDGTINHTMATLLVDAEGRVAFRKEGASWTVAEFLAAAQQLEDSGHSGPGN